MVNPAIIAGIVAGYTVGAVVTAFFAAEGPTDDVAATAIAIAAHPASRCAGALRQRGRAARCLVRRTPDRRVTTQRR